MSNEEEISRGDRRPGDPNYVSSLERRFGQIGDFWKRYDRLADQKDKEMSKNLNGNLDVLLIFVSRVAFILRGLAYRAIHSCAPTIRT